jgi:hypothetical protein
VPTCTGGALGFRIGFGFGPFYVSSSTRRRRKSAAEIRRQREANAAAFRLLVLLAGLVLLLAWLILKYTGLGLWLAARLIWFGGRVTFCRMTGSPVPKWPRNETVTLPKTQEHKASAQGREPRNAARATESRERAAALREKYASKPKSDPP